MSQSVVVQLVHQRYQATEFSRGKPFTREPSQVMSRQIGDQAALVLPIGHFTGDQELQVFRIHNDVTPRAICIGLAGLSGFKVEGTCALCQILRRY
jgi:hypothetical protein